MCDPICNCIENATPLIYSQSSRENASPPSGTSPLGPYKEVPAQDV